MTWAFLEALAFGRRRSAHADQDRRYLLAGVVTAAAWATAPEETARRVTAVAVGTVLALTIAYKLVSRVTCAAP
jgi:hypothetical protein